MWGQTRCISLHLSRLLHLVLILLLWIYSLCTFLFLAPKSVHCLACMPAYPRHPHATKITSQSSVYRASQPPTPQTLKDPQVRTNHPKPIQKILACSRGIYNDKSPGRWERKWVKNPFSIEIFLCKF